MKPWGCTHEKRRQDRLHSASGPAGSTDAAFDGAGLAGPFQVASSGRGLQVATSRFLQNFGGQGLLIHWFIVWVPTFQNWQERLPKEENEMLRFVPYRNLVKIFATLSSLSLTLDMSSCLVSDDREWIQSVRVVAIESLMAVLTLTSFQECLPWPRMRATSSSYRVLYLCRKLWHKATAILGDTARQKGFL